MLGRIKTDTPRFCGDKQDKPHHRGKKHKLDHQAYCDMHTKKLLGWFLSPAFPQKQCGAQISIAAVSKSTCATSPRGRIVQVKDFSELLHFPTEVIKSAWTFCRSAKVGPQRMDLKLLWSMIQRTKAAGLVSYVCGHSRKSTQPSSSLQWPRKVHSGLPQETTQGERREKMPVKTPPQTWTWLQHTN